MPLSATAIIHRLGSWKSPSKTTDSQKTARYYIISSAIVAIIATAIYAHFVDVDSAICRLFMYDKYAIRGMATATFIAAKFESSSIDKSEFFYR